MSSARQSNEEVIFNTARKIDSNEARQEYLVQVCAGDAALMERVENLLRSQADESQFLETPAVEFTQNWDVSEKAGEQIGRYKLLQRIGEGGFGVVYMAEQEKPIRRKVALKIIKAGMDTREVVARFEAERQALALMDHPNIAKVLDGGATEQGRPYFVMELVKGVPLTQFCDENKLDTSKRLELFQSVCKAIQHAHQKGIIHRDIKPSNVMVTLHDGDPIVKVIDFGVSKAISQQLTEKTMFTAYGQMIGTPQYMSPEQAEMSGLDIDTRSDIYSLGVLLYELLTGSTPIPPERLRETGFAEMQRLIKEEEPPRPSMRLSTLGDQTAKIAIARSSEPKKLGDLLRGELDWIVMKAIEKNRDRRYETANGLAKDVQRFLDGEAVAACPPSFAYRFRKFANKNRGVLVSVGSILFVLVLATILSTVFAINANQAKQEADRNLNDLIEEQSRFKKARGKEALENAFDQFLRGNIEASKKSLEIAREHGANRGEIALCEAAHVLYSGSYDFLNLLDIVLAEFPDSMAAKIILANYHLNGPELDIARFVELENQIIQMTPSSPIELLFAAQFFAEVDADLSIKYLKKLAQTHNSRLVYYEYSRVQTIKATDTYDLSEIEKFLKYAGVAFQTMPENELACRRYIWAHLSAADYYRINRMKELEKYHFEEAERTAKRFVKDYSQSARAHQARIAVHAYNEEWGEAIDLALKNNSILDRSDGYANSVALMIRQGKVPTLNESYNHLPGGNLWQVHTDLHSERGPTMARKTLNKWESENDRQLVGFELGMLFELKCLLGEPQAAVLMANQRAEKTIAINGPIPTQFRKHLFDYMTERITKEELIAFAKTRVEKNLGHAFAGFLKLGEGKRAEAMREFEQIEKQGKFAWGFYPMGFTCRALAYLHRLRQDSNWPSWIPPAESE